MRDLRDRMVNVKNSKDRRGRQQQEAYDRICARERRWHYSLELADRLIEGRREK